MFYDHGWFIDFHTIERAINERTRAIVLVNPNNPTGHFLRRHELEQLTAFGLPIISDEVFRDYQLNPAPDSVLTLQGCEDVLVFALNGLSKTVGLPQMKLAWMIANGPANVVREALERLEIIADTYFRWALRCNVRCRRCSICGRPVQRQILERLRGNLAVVAGAAARSGGGLVRDCADGGRRGIAPAARPRRAGAAGILLRFRKPEVYGAESAHSRRRFSGKGSHDFDSREAFFERRRHEFRGHQIQSACSGTTRARDEIAGLADVERNVEEEGFDFAVVLRARVDERAAVAARQIRRVDVSDRRAAA